MKIRVNGERRSLDSATTVGALVDRLGVPRDGTAVALNARVVARSDLDATSVGDGDEIEIISAVAGG
ncbi:MAG: sulfur carrier protein ThiS [Vulcanimicrobiaceae bacterium]